MTVPADPQRRAPWYRRPPLLISAGVVVVLAVVTALVVPGLLTHRTTVAHAAPSTAVQPQTATPTPTAAAIPPVPAAPTASELAALPEAKYDAVVQGLLGFSSPVADGVPTTVFHPSGGDLPLYGQDRIQPVSRLAADDFLDQPTTVVGVRQEGPWELVLTPARQELPSRAASGQAAPAQSSAWVPAALLTSVATPAQRIVISVEQQQVSIVNTDGTVVQTFTAGVGTSGTPTPTNVTGYLEQRYVDPSQGTGQHPIQLTSLHSSAADEPYGGHDGGLIGVHWNATTSGAISHGCVRLNETALNAIDALPLGTLVTVV